MAEATIKYRSFVKARNEIAAANIRVSFDARRWSSPGVSIRNAYYGELLDAGVRENEGWIRVGSYVDAFAGDYTRNMVAEAYAAACELLVANGWERCGDTNLWRKAVSA